MDSINIVIIANKRRLRIVAGINRICRNIVQIRHLVQTSNLDVPESMIIEFITEDFTALSACRIMVSKHTSFKIAVQSQHVAVTDINLLPLAQLAELDFCPSDHTFSHIYHPNFSGEITDIYRSYFFLNLIRLAHHRCNRPLRYGSLYGILPCCFIQRR